MDGQRVKLLLEGYLRGWLNFEYTQKYSDLREEIILNYIFEERLSDLLKNRLFVDASLSAGLIAHQKVDLANINSISNNILDLKLPSLKSKDRIKKEGNIKHAASLTKEEIDLFKKELATLQKINNTSNELSSK